MRRNGRVRRDEREGGDQRNEKLKEKGTRGGKREKDGRDIPSGLLAQFVSRHE